MCWLFGRKLLGLKKIGYKSVMIPFLFYNSVEINRAPVAQLVEHRAVMREVVSLTPARPTLRVLK